ncbi:MAG TPA: MFS transporter [Micropepsaceae bacterium]|nr:MFS transporter [Micropepsaceae bacterium]
MNGQDVFVKAAWRLIPFMMLLYIVNYIDRVNVGFAALTMNKDLAFSPAVYGFGAGAFFLGYSLFQIPANLILERVGARRWIFCILVVWGAISASNALVQTPANFYTVRILLGVAEAGFFPGMVLYLTYWFPPAYRARLIAIFMAAIPFANMVGGPLSSLVLQLDGAAGLHGWQWLFLIEAAPALLLAFVVLRFLPDGPETASWLTSEEKRTVAARLATEDSAQHHDFLPALRDPRLWALGVVYLGYSAGAYGVQLWLPQIVQAMGFSTLATGFLVALPYIVTMVAMIVWGRSSDASGERIWHVAVPAFIAFGGLIVASLTGSNFVVFIALTFVLAGLLALQGPFWSLPPMFLSGTAAAGGIGLINTIGTGFGGFIGPSLVGVIKDATGGYAVGMAVLAIGPMLTATIVLALGRSMAPRTAVQ